VFGICPGSRISIRILPKDGHKTRVDSSPKIFTSTILVTSLLRTPSNGIGIGGAFIGRLNSAATRTNQLFRYRSQFEVCGGKKKETNIGDRLMSTERSIRSSRIRPKIPPDLCFMRPEVFFFFARQRLPPFGSKKRSLALLILRPVRHGWIFIRL